MTARRALPVHGGGRRTHPEPGADARGLEAALGEAMAGEVRFDAYTRHVYATDASMYAIQPIGVVRPRDADDVAAAVEIAARFGVPILPRGAGTSLGGQTVGRAVVLDFSCAMNRIVSIDAEAGEAVVQPGVVQDDLNAAADPHGLWFAPDTSTSNRATLGGMIGNNSCGARSARYGMTIDHVRSLDVILSDGSRVHLGPTAPPEVGRRARGKDLEASLYRDLPRLVGAYADDIRTGIPQHWRRSGGYRLERMLPEAGPFDPSKLVIGSEGTLAVVVEASVALVQKPRFVSGVAGHFESVDAALGAVESARACGGAAIELVDHMILGLARRSPVHGPLASALIGEPGALLWVEFYGDSQAETADAAMRLEAEWRRHADAYAVVRADTVAVLRRFRELRKAGLGLLTAAGQGGERSLAFVEDTAVDPADLREYTRRFAAILEAHGLRAGFYGHASAGCLHIRPFMDLRRPGQIETMRTVAGRVAALVAEFGGMNSSEHGDGIVRAEFSRELFGERLYDAMREVKRVFDPHGRLNPGKKVDPPRMTEHLRDPALAEAIPLRTSFAFEGGMRAAANRCARIGACRRSPGSGGTMCPSFMATREEEHSTRGRANALVRALSMEDPAAALGDRRLHDILDLCLECKACRRECPLSVDMAALKSEFLSHYHAQNGTPAGAKLFGHVRTLNRIGSALAPLSNFASSAPFRTVLERFAGIDRRRPLPRFRRDTVQKWFARRGRRGDASCGRVVFLADSFTSFTEPEIGKAAIELLEQAGHEVVLAGDVCCGRALISKGLLREAKAAHTRLLDRLAPFALAGIPITGVEPSCVLTLKDELPAMAGDDEGAAAVAHAATLVDDLLLRAVDDGALHMDPVARAQPSRILFHAHCHQKAASVVHASVALLERIPGAEVVTLDAGCCGMAGSFGFEKEHYDLSLQIGALRLFPAVTAEPSAVLAATGVSCRHQIQHGTSRRAHHPAVLLHGALNGAALTPAHR